MVDKGNRKVVHLVLWSTDGGSNTK